MYGLVSRDVRPVSLGADLFLQSHFKTLWDCRQMFLFVVTGHAAFSVFYGLDWKKMCQRNYPASLKLFRFFFQDFWGPWVKGRQLWEMAADLCRIDTSGAQILSLAFVCVHGAGAHVDILFFCEGECCFQLRLKPSLKRKRNPPSISTFQLQPLTFPQLSTLFWPAFLTANLI